MDSAILFRISFIPDKKGIKAIMHSISPSQKAAMPVTALSMSKYQ